MTTSGWWHKWAITFRLPQKIKKHNQAYSKIKGVYSLTTPHLWLYFLTMTTLLNIKLVYFWGCFYFFLFDWQETRPTSELNKTLT